jgi:hypothetical protein
MPRLITTTYACEEWFGKVWQQNKELGSLQGQFVTSTLISDGGLERFQKSTTAQTGRAASAANTVFGDGEVTGRDGTETASYAGRKAASGRASNGGRTAEEEIGSKTWVQCYDFSIICAESKVVDSIYS